MNQYTDVSLGGSQTELKGLEGLSGLRKSPTLQDATSPYDIQNEELREKYLHALATLEFGTQQPRAFSWSQAAHPQQDIGHLVGESRHDKKITSMSQVMDVNNARGQIQPWWEQVAFGTAKMGILAGTTFVNSTLGFLWGAGTAIVEGRLSGVWDNSISNYMTNITNASEEWLQNHYTNYEMEAPWYNNIFTANFIGDKFIKNMGFTIGAIGAGMVTGGLMSSISAGIPGGAIMTRGLATLVSSAGEGIIEARHAADDFMQSNIHHVDNYIDEQTAKLNLEYAQKIQDIQTKYQGINDQFVAVDEGPDKPHSYKKQSMLAMEALEAEYEKDLQLLKQEKESLMDKLNEDALKVGNFTLGFNVLVLSITNNLQFGRILAGDFQSAKKGAALAMKSKSSGQRIRGAKEAAKAIGKKDLEFEAKTGFGRHVTARVLENIISEGFEEGTQEQISGTAQRKYSADLNTFAGAKINPDVQDGVNSFLTAANQAFQESFGTIDAPGWESVFLGALTGGLGVPFFKGGGGGKAGIRGLSPTWTGGFVEAYRKTVDDFKANDVVEQINKAIQDPEFVNRYQGLIRHEHYQELMNEYLTKNNEFEYANSEVGQLVSDVLMFRNANQLDVLKAFYESFTDLSQEDIDNIRKATTVEGTDISLKGGELVEHTQAALRERATKLSEAVDAITKIHDQHLVMYSDKFSEDGLEELTWMLYASKNHESRFTEKLNAFKEAISPFLKHLEKQQLKDSEGNILTELSKMDAWDLLVMMDENKEDASQAIIELLKSHRERYNNLIKESEQKDRQYKKDKGKTKKAKKHLRQMKEILAEAKKIEDSGMLENRGINLTLTFLDAVGSLQAINNLNERYIKAVKDPSTLEETIIDEHTKAEQAAQEIKNTKIWEKATKAKNLKQLKKEVKDLDPTERRNVLNQLQQEESEVSELARNLKDLDTIHEALGNLFNSEEFADLNTNDKQALYNNINRAYQLSENVEQFKKHFLETDDSLKDASQKMIDMYEKSEELSKGLKDDVSESKTPPTIKSEKTKVKDDIKKESDKVEKTKTKEDFKKDKSKANQTFDLSDFTYEDLFRVFPEYFDGDLNSLAAHPVENNELTQQVMKLLLEGEAKDLLTAFETAQENMKLSDEDMIKHIEKVQKEAKEIYKKYQEEKSYSNELISDTEALDIAEDTKDDIDTKSSMPNTQTSVRSDAITETVLALSTKKEGRIYVPLHRSQKKYQFLWKTLDNLGVFDFINKGELGKIINNDPNTKIHFVVSKDVNQHANNEGRRVLSEIVFLAVEHNSQNAVEIGDSKYQIVGAIKNNNSNAENIINKVLEEYHKQDSDWMVSDLHSTVEHIYPGRLVNQKGAIKTHESRPLTLEDRQNIPGKEFHIGVMRSNNTLYVPSLDASQIILPTTTGEKQGRVYLMIPAADGKYYASYLSNRMFNKSEFSEKDFGHTPIFQRIKSIMKEFMDTNLDDRTRLEARDEFEKFVHIGRRIGKDTTGTKNFRISYAEHNGVHFMQVNRIVGQDKNGKAIYEAVKRKDGQNWSINLEGNFESEFSQFLDLMDHINPRLQVNKTLIENPQMVDLLIESGVLLTDLAAFQFHDANFTINPLDSEGNIITPESKKTQPTKKQRSKNNLKSSEVEIVYELGDIVYGRTTGGVFIDTNTGRVITDKSTIRMLNAKYKIDRNIGILQVRKGAEGDMYSLTSNGEEYGAVKNHKTGSFKFYFGKEYNDIIKKYDKQVASQKQADKIKTKLSAEQTTNALQNFLDSENGSPGLLTTSIEGETAHLVIRHKSSGEVLFKEIIIKDDLDRLMEIAEQAKTQDINEAEAVHPILSEIVSEHTGLTKTDAQESTLESKPVTKLNTEETSQKRIQEKKDQIDQLLGVKQSEETVKGLQQLEKTSNFESFKREDIKAIRESMKQRGVENVSLNKMVLEQQVAETLNMDKADLATLSIEAILSKLKC